MKKLSKIIVAGIVLVTTLASCQRDLTSLNVDPKHLSQTQVPSGNYLATSMFQFAYYMYTPNVNYNNFRFFTQQWTETVYEDETNYNLVTRTQPRLHWNRMFVYSLNNLELAKSSLKVEANSSKVAANKLASIEIQEILVWESIVNTYGNVPYTEAFNIANNVLPKYDDAKTIYTDLIARLNAVIATIDTSSNGYASEDVVYKGDMSKWKKLANSIKLRLGINLADVDAPLAKSTVESAVASGIMSSDADSYKFSFDGGTFLNPVYEALVSSGRTDFIPTELVINTMNSTSDPRRSVWFTKTSSGDYKGGVFGTTNSYSAFSHMTSFFTAANGFVKLVGNTEMKFILAEAAARGYNVGGTAASLYTSAVTASLEETGVSSADTTAFLTANPYDASNWKKSIGTQAWIALFDNAYPAWNFTRRLDYPILKNPGSSLLSSVPYRMPYSDQEYTLNLENVTAAATAIGGDKATTKLFWDKF